MPVTRPLPRHARRAACLLAAALVAGGPAWAAPPAAPGGPAAKAAPHPPVSLDDLFARLKASDDPAESKGIAALIERRMARSGSVTVDLLTERAGAAITGKDVPLAIELVDRALALEPAWAEGWHRRATLFWRLSDTATAIADLQRALVLEPRHYEAWAALGKLYLADDDKRRALDAFRRAEAIYPRWDVLAKAIERLAPEIDGRDL